ncbi:MAG: ubiquinol-cytochrome C chaperone family protein [Acetobacterales bacterium]
MFLNSRKRRDVADAADRLYAAAVAQARQPGFYRDLGVPDTVDGRFELIALHVFLLVDRLQRDGEPGRETAQALFDAMFSDMDCCLREMGVGDLGVGKKVKFMAQGFNGRCIAYAEALRRPGNDEAMHVALRRNVFGTVSQEPPGHALHALCAYLRREAETLAAAPGGPLLQGRAAFGAAPALDGGRP